MISRAEADTFLVNVLRFKNWEQLLERNRLEFIHTLVPHYAHRLSFQNISMASVPKESRHVPTEEDIIKAGLSGISGPCINQNAFLAVLLKSLGFNSYVVSGFVHGPGNRPDNHVICVVEFDSNEKYMLDLGVGLPFAGPVPMHDLPYTRTASGVRYRYKEAGDKPGTFYRVQLDGALYGTPFVPKDTEFVRYEFKMKPVSINFFQEHLQDIFTNEDESIFLQQPFMFRYFEENDAGELLPDANVNGDRKWILIRGCSVLIGTDHTREVTHYNNYDEVKEKVIYKYFPHFAREDVENAVACFNESVPKHGFYKAHTE